LPRALFPDRQNAPTLWTIYISERRLRNTPVNAARRGALSSVRPPEPTLTLNAMITSAIPVIAVSDFARAEDYYCVALRGGRWLKKTEVLVSVCTSPEKTDRA
jgi:hypothetical protein